MIRIRFFKLLIITMIITPYNLYAQAIEEAYTDVVSNCKETTAVDFFKKTDNLNRVLSDFEKKTSLEERNEKVDADSFGGRIMLYLGAPILGPINEGERRATKSCWVYFDDFRDHGKRKMYKRADVDISNWKVCLQGIDENLPVVVTDIISCYEKTKK